MFLLYHASTAPTGRILGDALQIPHGSRPPEDRQDVLIRWGSRASVQYRPELTLNPRIAIDRATDKYESLHLMRQAGIVVPNHNANQTALRAPMLGRRRNHTRGTDIHLCLQQSDAIRAICQGAEYFVEYVPVAREYRARVVGNECVRVSEKVLRNEAAYVPHCRNYETGHIFVSPRVRLNAFQEAMAVAAVQVHGLHFGAVDLIVGDDGQTYVLEVNTAPALAPRSAGAMLAGMARLIKERMDIELDVAYGVLDLLSATDDGDGDTEDVTDDSF